jgi:hypothetical protein
VIGDLPMSTIETGHITKILEPIWATKTETAYGMAPLALRFAVLTACRAQEVLAPG